MSTAFLGQIALFAFNAVPRGWAPCAGQLLPVNQNQPLFALLGATYGGDGMRNFALPDLRGLVPIASSPELPQGASGGEATHVLATAEMPSHQHNLMADASSPTGGKPSPQTVLGRSSGRVNLGGTGFNAPLYGGGNPNAVLNNAAIAPAGDGQPHENRMPSLALTFCICIDPNARFPTRG